MTREPTLHATRPLRIGSYPPALWDASGRYVTCPRTQLMHGERHRGPLSHGTRQLTGLLLGAPASYHLSHNPRRTISLQGSARCACELD